MKYRLVTQDTDTGLEEVINKLLQEGWKLYGNPFVDGRLIFQAMIKEE